MRSGGPPLLLPRGLIFVASTWLIASWVIAIGVRTPVQPTSATYTPNVRLMLLCVTMGLMLAWPMLRLSQVRPSYPIRQTLLDLLVLGGLVQVVVWPLRLVTSWTPSRTAAIDATLTGWVVLAGAVVAAAISSDRLGTRTLAMMACVAMCLLGPALAWIGLVSGIDTADLARLSPFMAVGTLGSASGAHATVDQWRAIAVLLIADLAVWLALAASLHVGAVRRARGSGLPAA